MGGGQTESKQERNEYRWEASYDNYEREFMQLNLNPRHYYRPCRFQAHTLFQGLAPPFCLRSGCLWLDYPTNGGDRDEVMELQNS